MKKRFIPATVAALALTFSAVAVPQAVAQQAIEIGVIDGAELELEAGTFWAGYQINVDEDETVMVEGLPDGLSFNSETNIVSGTPTTPHAQGQSSTVTVTLVNESDEAETATATIIVTADTTAPKIDDIAVGTWEVNTPIAPVEIVLSEDATVEVTGLPEGLRYDSEFDDPDFVSEAASGAIVGTPTQATTTGANRSVTITATDAAGNQGTQSFSYTVSVDDTAPEITKIEDTNLEVGTAVDIEVEVSEPATVVVEGLPDGLSYDAESGRIVGVPTAVTPAGEPAEVTVNATDAAGNEAEEVTFTITVGPDVTDPVIENPGSQRFVVNEAIDPIEIEVNETATVTVDGLPVGLSFDSEGLVISGTPTVSGNPVTVTIRAVDEAGNSSTETFTVTVVDAEEEDPSSIGSGEGSSADDVNWGLVGLGGVLAAVIGVIAAIGGGFIQLPPALANLIPFL